jgi:hypothetical protein
MAITGSMGKPMAAASMAEINNTPHGPMGARIFQRKAVYFVRMVFIVFKKKF